MIAVTTNLPGGNQRIYKTTVNRSPFISKISRDQLESRSYFNETKSVHPVPSLKACLDYSTILSSHPQVITYNYCLEDKISIKLYV